jgi:hypothetical protein
MVDPKAQKRLVIQPIITRNVLDHVQLDLVQFAEDEFGMNYAANSVDTYSKLLASKGT